jgi:Lar family restriction alleviation protein
MEEGMSEEVKLKECPFCGGREIVLKPFISSNGVEVIPDFWYLACSNCGCRTANMSGRASCAAAWNRREPLDPDPNFVAWMKNRNETQEKSAAEVLKVMGQKASDDAEIARLKALLAEGLMRMESITHSESIPSCTCSYCDWKRRAKEALRGPAPTDPDFNLAEWPKSCEECESTLCDIKCPHHRLKKRVGPFEILKEGEKPTAALADPSRFTFEEVRDKLCEACRFGVPILPDSGGQHGCNGHLITCNASLWIALNSKSEDLS